MSDQVAQPRPCQGPRNDLIQCVLRSDCVLKKGKTVAECIRSQAELPAQCRYLTSNYADCKKGMLDMSRRFRGNHLSDAAIQAGKPAAQNGTGFTEIDPTTGDQR